MNIIGDVGGRTCLMVDDMVDTAGTLCAAAKELKKNGASRVVAYCTHPILSGKAIENIENSTLDRLMVMDTIPLKKEAIECPKIKQLSVADELAESIKKAVKPVKNTWFSPSYRRKMVKVLTKRACRGLLVS